MGEKKEESERPPGSLLMVMGLLSASNKHSLLHSAQRTTIQFFQVLGQKELLRFLPKIPDCSKVCSRSCMFPSASSMGNY